MSNEVRQTTPYGPVPTIPEHGHLIISAGYQMKIWNGERWMPVGFWHRLRWLIMGRFI